jgi:hypothetical protein
MHESRRQAEVQLAGFVPRLVPGVEMARMGKA